MVVSRGRAERRPRSLGRFARQLTTKTSCSLKPTQPLSGGAADCRDCPPITTARVDARQLSEVQERPRRPGNPDRVREFDCIGVSPPEDHPHIYIDMGAADTIPCPYCGTRFRFDPRLTPLDADPPDSFFAEDNAT